MIGRLPRPGLFMLLGVLLLAAGCSTPLPKNTDRQASFALPAAAGTPLDQVVAEHLQDHTGQTGLRVFGHSLDGFVARIMLADIAQRSIDAQYYLIDEGTTGTLFLNSLLQAAERGARVRLLIDDIDLEQRDALLLGLAARPNFELRVFNPFSRGGSRGGQFLSRFGEVSRRMHNKSFTVDNRVSIIGGRNIGDHYFAADHDLSFLDLDLMVIGPAVKGVSAEFDTYWNDPLAYPAAELIQHPPSRQDIDEAVYRLRRDADAYASSPYAQAVRGSALAQAFRSRQLVFNWGHAEVAFDDPDKLTPSPDDDKYLLAGRVDDYLSGVASELILFSAYFVPTEAMLKAFSDMRERGVRIRILTNSLASTDVAVVHAGYARHRKQLLAMGVELHELNPQWVRREGRPSWLGDGESRASLHEKAFIIDRRIGFIGSMNFDPRSFDLNTEIGIFFESPAEASAMGDWFDRHIDRLAFRLELVRDDGGSEHIVWYYRGDDGEEVYQSEPHAGFWRKFGVGVVGLLPLDWLL